MQCIDVESVYLGGRRDGGRRHHGGRLEASPSKGIAGRASLGLTAQEFRSSQLGEHRVATAIRDVPKLPGAQMLRWTGILRGKELHSVTDTSENDHAIAVSLRECRPTAAEKQTDRVRRQNGQPQRKYFKISAALHY